MARPVPPSIQVRRAGSTLRPTRSPAFTFAVGGATMRASCPSMAPVRSRCEPIGSTTRTSKGMPEPFGLRLASSPRSPSSRFCPVGRAWQRGLADPRRASAALDLDEVHGRDADEAADEAGRGRGVDLERRADLVDLAAIHHGDAVGEAHGLGLVVRHVDRRGAGLAQHRLQLRAHLEPQQRVEIGERLVHEQHGGLDGERARHRHALALAARELGRIAVEIALDMEQAPPRARPCASRRACDAFCMRRPKATFSNTVMCGKTA